MYTLSIKKVLFFSIMVFLCVPCSSFADETYSISTAFTTPSFRFNNDNWFTHEHPKVATFTMHSDGSADGLTETGVPFVQYNVPNTAGIRIQRFEIEDHYHYIINGEIAYTFEELSAYLAQAYEAQSAV